jgi:hypothetical protein
MANPTTVEELLDYWPGNIPFKGSLVSKDGSCMCAQGQALHFLDSMSAQDLSNLEQAKADKRIAELFGISRAHAVLLRVVNDRQDGAPSVVIRDPAQVIGDQAHVVLAFWRHLDRMSGNDRAAARAAAWDAARAAAGAAAGAAAVDAAGDAAGAAARAAAGDAAWDAAGDAAWDAAGAAARAAAGDAAWATNEIQGAAVIRAKGLPFFFLPLFGFAEPEAVLAADKA